jgi:hypothetical protein
MQGEIDHFEHSIEVFVHVSIADTHDKEARGFEHARPLFVAPQCGSGCMRNAIDFDDKLSFQGHEIDNVPVDRMLAAKLPSRHSAISQRLPEPKLRARLRSAQLS